jgi:hypothetical protein
MDQVSSYSSQGGDASMDRGTAYSLGDDVSLASRAATTVDGHATDVMTAHSTVSASRTDVMTAHSTVTATRPEEEEDDELFDSISGMGGMAIEPEPERLRPEPGIYQIRPAGPTGWAVDMYGFHSVHDRTLNRVAMYPAKTGSREEVNVNQRWVVAPKPDGPPDAYTIAPFCCAARGMQLALHSDGTTVVRRVAPGEAGHGWRFLAAAGPQDAPSPGAPLRVHIRSTARSPGGYEKANLGHQLSAAMSSVGALANAALNLAGQRVTLAETGASTRNPRQVFTLIRQELPTEAECRRARTGQMSPR